MVRHLGLDGAARLEPFHDHAAALAHDVENDRDEDEDGEEGACVQAFALLLREVVLLVKRCLCLGIEGNHFGW